MSKKKDLRGITKTQKQLYQQVSKSFRSLLHNPDNKVNLFLKIMYQQCLYSCTVFGKESVLHWADISVQTTVQKIFYNYLLVIKKGILNGKV